ncbi:hypothetical protein QWA68_007034, partial [Fusarium oxysporum]
PASKSARTNEAPREQQAESSQVRKGSRKRRILRGPKGEVMIPEDLPKECFWAKLKCAHGRNPLHFLSEFDPLISLDETPDYEITFRSRRWWEDHDPWLDAYKEALKTSDEGWKMRDEAMKQDDSVPDDEGADDWDFMCLPIPRYEDGKFCGEFEDDDDEEGDGETANNAGKENGEKPFYSQVAQFDSVFQPTSSYRDFWPEVEGVAMILQRGQLNFNNYRQIKSIRGSPAGWMDKWENVDWQSRLRDYKDEKGSDKLGGHDFDITTMTEIERWRHEDKWHRTARIQ